MKTGYEYGRRWLVWERHCRRPCLYHGLTVMHAMPDGGLVLKGQSSWRTVCGFMVSGKTWHVLVQFRRFTR
jgi:hypothetical protein